MRIVFFWTLYGENTESALPLLNFLNLLRVDNIYKHQTLKFIHNWHKHQLPSIFDKYFKYSKNVHSFNTRYASKDNLDQYRARTNTGKQTISSLGFSLWQKWDLKLCLAASIDMLNYVLAYNLCAKSCSGFQFLFSVLKFGSVSVTVF